MKTASGHIQRPPTLLETFPPLRPGQQGPRVEAALTHLEFDARHGSTKAVVERAKRHSFHVERDVLPAIVRALNRRRMAREKLAELVDREVEAAAGRYFGIWPWKPQRFPRFPFDAINNFLAVQELVIRVRGTLRRRHKIWDSGSPDYGQIIDCLNQQLEQLEVHEPQIDHGRAETWPAANDRLHRHYVPTRCISALRRYVGGDLNDARDIEDTQIERAAFALVDAVLRSRRSARGKRRESARSGESTSWAERLYSNAEHLIWAREHLRSMQTRRQFVLAARRAYQATAAGRRRLEWLREERARAQAERCALAREAQMLVLRQL